MPFRTAAFWAVYRVLDRAPVMSQPADRVRAAANRRTRLMALPWASLITGRADRSVEIRDTSMPLPDGTEIALRVYRPREAGTEPLPVVVNFHGGGWVSGDLQHSQWLCAGVAARAGVVVVSVDYRLAPEHPFPIPVEDCYAATTWVAEHASEFGIDPGRLGVMGDSAGGNLAAVVCVVARDRGGPPIALQILIYPSAAPGADCPSKHENANGPILTKRDVENTPHLYLGGSGADLKDPYVSPVYADLHGMPPALVQTAQFDPIRDHGIAFAAALRDAGVEVRHTNYVDAVHGFASLPGLVPVAGQALDEVVAAVRTHL